MNLATYLAPLREATLAARQRTGDSAIGTQAEKGRIRVARITFPNGPRRAPLVEPLTTWLPIEEACDFLKKL